ncbi:hypothetical protein SESBI_35537 [Sesbania bispinosa]|nr:hypothetical protein SESBI_35537 [Sesbania bispinosa]
MDGIPRGREWPLFPSNPSLVMAPLHPTAIVVPFMAEPSPLEKKSAGRKMDFTQAQQIIGANQSI